MHSKKEIILRFPLVKSIIQNKDFVKENEKFKKLKEKGLYIKHVTENEWHQEYYLIYNSYVLDNGY